MVTALMRKKKSSRKLPFSVCLPQILAGGGDQTEIDLPRLLPSNPHETSILKHLQKFGLHGKIQVADLIQKEGSHLRQFHAAALGCICPGEGALFISEEFRLDQGMRNRRTGHFDPSALRAIRVGMQ